MDESVVTINQREVDGCMVLDVSAERFTYPQSGQLKSEVAKLIEQNHRFFVMNMAGVKLVDSYGLASIVSALKMIKEHGGGLALYGLSDMFVRLVEVTHLDRVLEVWPTEAQATYYLATQFKIHSTH